MINGNEKLKKLISRRLKSEAELVYVLVEIRKIFDESSGNERDKYSTVYFVCNWALHIKMDRSSARRVLSKIEQELKNRKHFVEAAVGLFMFSDFFHELRFFLQEREMPVDWTFDKPRSSITDLLHEILSGVPIENPTGYLQRLVFKTMIAPKKGISVGYVSKDTKAGWHIEQQKISTRQREAYLKQPSTTTKQLGYNKW